MSVPVIYFDLGNTLVFGPAGNKQPFPDAAATIEELWLRGYQIGILSDQSVGTTIADMRQKLDDYGLESSRFDVITISSEFSPPIWKPDPAIFDAALTKAGHSAASNNTVFVTENLDHINAARNLGWRAIHKPYQASCTTASGECVEDLDDLLALFPPLPIDLYIRDASDDPGDDLYTGSNFWNPPDLWIRNSDDSGITHQTPIAGNDNWFNCRLHNRGVGIARRFFVFFKIQEWVGTQFVYSSDYFPATAVAAGSGIAPGDSVVVKQRWAAEDVPPAGTHACWLAAVWIASDQPMMGAHPWEHNNLAQKNLAIVELGAGETGEVAVVLGNRLVLDDRFERLELHRVANAVELQVDLVGHGVETMAKLVRSGWAFPRALPPTKSETREICLRFLDPTRVEVASADARDNALMMELESGSILTLRDSLLPVQRRMIQRLPKAEPATLLKDKQGIGAISFAQSRISAIGLGFRAGQIVRSTLRFTVPKTAKSGDRFDLDLVQRSADGRIEGGVSIQINVKVKKRRTRNKSKSN